MDATRRPGALAALMQAALALPVLVVPARAGAAEIVGEAGFSVLGYRERGLMKVTEPVAWVRAEREGWEIRASALVDIITGASAQLVTNLGGAPVQTISGASISDRRRAGDVRLAKRLGEVTLAASRSVSNEEDYRSRAYGLEARWDLDEKRTTLVAGYGKANDRVGSADDLSLDERRDTEEFLAGLTRVLSPAAVVQTTLQSSRGRGWYNDPYKFTLTSYPGGGAPAFAADRRPDARASLAWLTRFRHHFEGRAATLQADYRYYRDDWGVRAHALEVAWHQDLGGDWALRPALRYYTQSQADFYGAEIPRPQPAVFSSDQRLAAFGGLSPSVRAIRRFDSGLSVEATVGYYHNAGNLRPGGSGSSAFETLRAAYVLVGFTHPF